MIYIKVFGMLLLAVLLHELGHLLTSKYYGVYVSEFSLCMGSKLFGFNLGKTT